MANHGLLAPASIMTAALPVQGTFYAHRAFSGDMRVNHGTAYIGMAQQFLYRADVAAGRHQMRRKAMAKGMTTCRLQDPRLMHRGLHRPLHDLFMFMVARRPARVHVST